MIGILDLFGYSTSNQNNGFEQLVINFANEKLHQIILDKTLKQQQEQYQQEGIEWKPIDFLDNLPICHLIEKNHFGILSCLDEVCLRKSQMQMSSGCSSASEGDDSHPYVHQSPGVSLFMDHLNDTIGRGRKHPNLVLNSDQENGKDLPPYCFK